MPPVSARGERKFIGVVHALRAKFHFPQSEE